MCYGVAGATFSGMSAKTTLQELDDLRTAIQSLVSSGASTVTIDGVTYSRVSLAQYQQREDQLLRRLSIRNIRKRTVPDYS